MCYQCNYQEILSGAGLEATDNRVRVLEIVGNNNFPLSAGDVYNTISRNDSINRVTVYRILGLLVDSGIVDRITTAGKASYYGLAPNQHHRPHAHFYCTECGRMDCLSPDMIDVNTAPFLNTFPGRINKVEVRIDGVCGGCARNGSE